MNTAYLNPETNNLINIAEPILISHYKIETGNSPTLYELKQYLVSLTSDKLIAILKNSESKNFKEMPKNELLAVINLYIRRLRVW